jgi:hypothetical protein
MPGLEASERTHNGSGLHNMNIIIANLSLVFIVLSMRLPRLASLLSRAAHRDQTKVFSARRHEKGEERQEKLLTLISSSTKLTSEKKSIFNPTRSSGNTQPSTRSRGEMEKPNGKFAVAAEKVAGWDGFVSDVGGREAISVDFRLE